MKKLSLFPPRKAHLVALLGVAAFLGCTLPSAPGLAAKLKLHTDQQMIEELMEPVDLDINSPIAVFAAVFDALPDKVTVYPSESYYYFTFPYKGIIYAGNIRFDAFDQFDGKVHFTYFPEYAYWRKPTEEIHRKLGAEEGVQVAQVDKLHYKITYKDKTVAFDIPDLSQVKPPAGMLRPDETFIGTSWDESGVQFFLIFNKTAKTFLFLLNDNPKMDIYEPTDVAPELRVGNRTSFTFYKDKLIDRQILVGVYAGNTQLNNYFDGPFDQLPDNFIEGNTLHDAILEIIPEVKDKIDRYGGLVGGAERYAITPYKYYDRVEELKPIVDCANKTNDPAEYYSCFNVLQDGEDDQGPEPQQGAQSSPPPSSPPAQK